jgi:hypothetical protein
MNGFIPFLVYCFISTGQCSIVELVTVEKTEPECDKAIALFMKESKHIFAQWKDPKDLRVSYGCKRMVGV